MNKFSRRSMLIHKRWRNGRREATPLDLRSSAACMSAVHLFWTERKPGMRSDWIRILTRIPCAILFELKLFMLKNNFVSRAACETRCLGKWTTCSQLGSNLGANLVSLENPQLMTVNPCASGHPLEDRTGRARQCSEKKQCPKDHYCHIGLEDSTTVCCPVIGIYSISFWHFSNLFLILGLLTRASNACFCSCLKCWKSVFHSIIFVGRNSATWRLGGCCS
jgi:hypothetical protein